jgi:pyrroline-5-carboxylate reductase
MKVAILGCGKIGEALLAGMLQAESLKAADVQVTTARLETANALAQRHGIEAGTDNLAAIAHADWVILGLKPQKTPSVCKEIAERLKPGTVVVSLATGIPVAVLEGYFPEHVRVLRAMPNTPIMIRQGMTVLARGTRATEEDVKVAKRLFGSVGETVEIADELMNAATGLSASGPAYIYVIIESLAEAGVKVGLPRDLATTLAAQATKGAASLVLETGKHPALLKDNVTTPAGVTIDGLMELEAGGVRVALIKAIVMSSRRAEEIQEKLMASLQKP